jgi:hypothetical protein
MTTHFSAGDNPTVEAVVEAVLEVVPEAERETTRSFVEPIARHRLEGLSTHPRPASLAEVVYQHLRELLAVVDPEERIHRLQEEALSTEIDRLLQDSLMLAIARYGHDHPDAARANAWVAHRPGWLNRDSGFYADEAGRLRQERERLLERVGAAEAENAPPLRAALRRADLNLGSATTGAFGTASGSLADFLREVGADFRYLDIE